jgi:hypothetical protein
MRFSEQSLSMEKQCSYADQSVSSMENVASSLLFKVINLFKETGGHHEDDSEFVYGGS